MRVAHVLKVKAIAGAETHLLILLQGQRARGIDAQFVIMVTPSNPMESMVEAAASRGIPLQRLTIRSHADVTVYPRLTRILRDLKPDVAHTHLQHGDLYGIPAARLAGVPVVVTSRHNDDIRRRQALLRLLNRALWGMADGGIATSEAIRQFSITVEGAAPDKVRTIHYGIDPQANVIDAKTARATLRRELGLGSDALLIGMVCRLIELKGVQYAIRALAQLRESFPDAHLVIAGDGPQRASLAAEAARLGMSRQAHFLGWRQNIPAIMAALDVLAVASDREGFGLVLLEAMAQSVPIIATNVSAIPEIVVDGETGLLVPPRQPDAIADALRRLLADKPLRGHMGLLGQDRLETHFSAARMVDETAALYRELALNRGLKTSV